VTATSVYIANSSSDITTAEDWLGKKLDSMQLVGGFASWWDWSNSPSWIASQVAGSDAQIHWSIGLIPWGANLADAAAGKYDDKYLALAQQMAAANTSQDQIYIRLGWEFNAPGWFPWSAVGQASNYVGAFQQFVDTFRSVSDKFVFEWTPNAGNMGMNPADAYPGDKYVDVIGQDFYYNTQWDPKDPVAAWNWYVNQPYGLQWQQDFAAAHGKETAIGEWGVNSDTAGPFIELAAQWFQDHNMLYQNYWNSNAAFQGSLSDGQYPQAAAVYQAIFGGSQTDPYANDTTIVNRTGGSQVDVLIGHAGNDALDGGAGDDWLHGGAGNDKLIGGIGNDVLDGGTGADTMTGGAGDDIYYVDNAGDQLIEAAGAGHDKVYSSISYTLSDNVEDLVLTGKANLSATGNALDNVITGNDGNNVINGGAGNDWIDGDHGADTLTGGAGNDTFVFHGGFGHDVITDFGANGDKDVIDLSTIYKNGFKASVYQSGEDAVINLGAGNDIRLTGVQVSQLQQTSTGFALSGGTPMTAIKGGDTNDHIIGTSGDDRIDGGAGADVLTGGAGNDTFAFVSAFGHDTITDFGANGDKDTIDFSTIYKSGFKATLYQSGEDTMISFGGGNDVRLTGVQLSQLQQTTTGLALQGGSPLTTLNGGTTNDHIVGGSGNDVINGGYGADTLTGGSGNDTFVFVSAFGHDVITDFGAGGDKDVLDFSTPYKSGFKGTVVQLGSDTLISFGGGNDVRLLGVHADQVHLSATGMAYA
jgi:Ca2+-binding RTX toxin-like protein